MNTKILKQKILENLILGGNWKMSKIKDISVSIQYGYTGSAISKGQYKMLRITDIQDDTVIWDTVPFVEIDDVKAQNYLLENNDIVFARTGATVGKSYLIKDLREKSVFASYLIRIKIKKDLDVQYVKYFFESGFYWQQIQDKAVGTGQPNVNGTLLGELLIPLPPLSVQQQIVSQIEILFVEIDRIEQSRQNLLQTVKLAKQKTLAELLNNDGWDSKKLGEVGHWQAGTTPSRTNKAYYENGTIPWLKTGDLNDSFVSEVPEKITELAKQELKQLKLHPKGSVAIALYGATIGKCGILDIETTTNQACLVCRPNELIGNKYLFYYLISKNDYFKKVAGGGAQPNISKDIVVKTDIPLPPLSVQQQIVSKIEEIFAEIEKIEKAVKH